jgi:hypothetical protein
LQQSKAAQPAGRVETVPGIMGAVPWLRRCDAKKSLSVWLTTSARAPNVVTLHCKQSRTGTGRQEAVMGIVIWLLVGAVAGWLAGMIVKGYGFGLVG